MILYIVIAIVWSTIGVYLGIHLNSKLDTNRIESLERSRDFHKYQKETFVEQARKIVEENNKLKEHNTQLISENEELKKALDKKENVTYNYYINK